MNVRKTTLKRGCLSKRKKNVRYLCRVETENIAPITPRSRIEKKLCVSQTPRTNPLIMPRPAPTNGPSKPPARVHGSAEKIMIVEPGGCSGKPGTGSVERLNSKPRNNAV